MNTYKNTHNTLSVFFYNPCWPQLISITRTHGNKIAVFTIMFWFYGVLTFLLPAINNDGRGLFLPGQNYMMSGLDVTQRSRLEMRL